MRSAASDRVILALLLGMVVASIWLKSVARPPVERAPAAMLERTLAERLTARGFATAARTLPLGSVVVEGRRGDCRVSARDAGGVLGGEAGFAEAARAVGPVSFLYDGRRYPHPPTLRIRVARLGNEAARLVGIVTPVHRPIALATSPACGSDTFGLATI